MNKELAGGLDKNDHVIKKKLNKYLLAEVTEVESNQ